MILINIRLNKCVIKLVLEHGRTLDSALDWYKNQKMCDETVDDYPDALEFVPGWFKTQKMCDKAVNTHPFLIKSLPKR